MTISELLNNYLEHLESRNYSKDTIRTNSYNIKRFVKFISENYDVNKINLLRKSHLDAWFNSIANKITKKGMPLKPRSVNKLIECTRGFLTFLTKRGYVLNALSDFLQYVKVPHLLPLGIISASDMKKLLCSIQTNSIEGYRDRTMLELMYSSGIRAGELVTLNVQDINFSENTAKVLGKGNKERIVPIGKTAMNFIETYTKAVRPFLMKKGKINSLFINHDSKRLQYSSLLRTIHQCAENAKLADNVTAHTFRRTCATELVRSNANLYHVKEILGHESLETLKHYAKLSIVDIKKTHAKCHPRS